MALESLPKIAPALFSAEQDLIQIYNKKTDTTGVINPSYIKSSPSGTAGAIQFSDGSAFASDASNLFWDNTNKRLGIGTNVPTQTLDVNGSAIFSSSVTSLGDFRTHNVQANNNASNGRVALQTWDNMIVNVEDGGVGIAKGVYLTPSAQVHIKGSGSTYATTSLLVQNSLGTEYLKVLDNGDATMHRLGLTSALKVQFINTQNDSYTAIQLNSTNGNVYFPQAVGIGTNAPSATVDILPPTQTATATQFDCFRVGYSNSTIGVTNGSAFQVQVATTGASRYSTTLRLSGGSDTSQSYLKGFDSNLFGVMLNRAQSNLGLFSDNGIMLGNTAFAGSEGSASAQVHIKGSGTTSGTTSLLVQNGVGTTALQVTDDRTTFVNGLLNVGTANTGLDFSGANCIIFNNGGSSGNISLSMGGNTYFQIYQPKDAGSGITSGTINTITTPIGYGWSSGSASPNLLSLNPSINNTGTYSGTFRGIYYNPTLTSLTGTTHYGIQTTSGGAYINTTTPQASACLQADSTTQGFLPPRMTDAEIRAIVAPVNGLVAYNTDINHLCCYQGGAWVKFSHSPM